MAAYDRQIVVALPATLHPSTVYEVARPDGRTHDVYVVDALGVPVAMRLVLIKGDPGSQEIVDQALAAARDAETARAEAARLAALLRADQTAFKVMANEQIAALRQMAEAMRGTQAATDAALTEAARVLAEYRAVANGNGPAGPRLVGSFPLVIYGGSPAPPDPPIPADTTTTPDVGYGGQI